MRRNRRGYLIAGGVMVLLVLLVALFAEKITTVSPYYFHTKPSVLDGMPPFAPSAAAPLGTDPSGRDVWSRIAYGARWSLFFAFLIMAARLVLAIPMAMLAAFGPRWINWLVNRLYVMTSAIPPLLIYILILSSPGLRNIGLWPCVTITVALLTLIEWPRIAVGLRGRLEQLSAEPFVEGAVAAGATGSHIFWVQLMPHLWPTLLQVISAEMARGLLNIAQLGFFGIFVGGGILEKVDTDPGGRAIVNITTGVPEWGTMLADARYYVGIANWIPLAPATAFLIGVSGFSLLSQGLEGVAVSFGGIRERLTVRVRWTLRGAVALAVIASILLYSHGLPWGSQEAILALSNKQADAFSVGNFTELESTLVPDDPALRKGAETWLKNIPRDGMQVAMIRPSGMHISGGDATGYWTIAFGYTYGPPITLTRSVHLIRTFSGWRDAGEVLTSLRGLHVDIEANYDPTDPTLDAITNRSRVNTVASVADHAYDTAIATLPKGIAAERVTLRLYPSHEAYALAVYGQGGSLADGKGTAWQSPQNVIYLSPAFLIGLNRRSMIQALAFEMLKRFTSTQLHTTQVLPVLSGSLELSLNPRPYTFFYDGLFGHQFYTLEEILSQEPDRLGPSERPLYMVQSALLVEFLEKTLSPDQLYALIQNPQSDFRTTLAQAMNMDPTQLSRQYSAYVYQRVADRSVLNLAGGKSRIPQALLDALNARVQGVAAELQAAGVQQYRPTLIDMDKDTTTSRATVTVLEQYTLNTGESVAALSQQQWTEKNGVWQLTKIMTPWTPKPAGAKP